jgi:hypothetical protein
MDSTIALTNLVYAAFGYMLAYLLYLLVKEAGARSGAVYPNMPYDANHLILRRRYI